MAGKEYQVGFSVVLPNYNGRDLLEKNLPSLQGALTEAGVPYEIIVSDDCSTDDSVEYLRFRYPDVKIVGTSENSGFATACNTGLAEVQYSYTCIVNTDVTFDSSYFKNSVKYFEEPNLFAIKGDIVNYRDRLDNILNIDKDIVVYFKRGLFKFTAAEKSSLANYDHLLVLLGCCFVCRTDLIKTMGGYDERFSPYFWEDLDLAMRAIEKGYDLAYVPDCKIYHQLSSTIKKTQPNSKVHLVSNRNKFILAWKHLDSPMRWSIHVFFILGSILVRWIKLDRKYYVALFLAIVRYRKKVKSALPE